MTKPTKNYHASPLPFQGQKRFFLKAFKNALQEFPDDATYVDLFGGSGLLSHTIKQEKPNARVIWNDFYNFQQRLDNIERTNDILRRLSPFLITEGSGKYPPESKEAILQFLEKEEAKNDGFIDFITLSSKLLFSGKYAKNIKEPGRVNFFIGNCNKKDKTYNAEGYLQGVERVQMDFKELFEKFEKVKNVVFVFDPPYLSTEIPAYNVDGKFWHLKNFLQVIASVNRCERFFFFTSDKSQTLELVDFLKESHFISENSLITANVVRRRNYTGGGRDEGYEDIMLYR